MLAEQLQGPVMNRQSIIAAFAAIAAAILSGCVTERPYYGGSYDTGVGEHYSGRGAYSSSSIGYGSSAYYGYGAPYGSLYAYPGGWGGSFSISFGGYAGYPGYGYPGVGYPGYGYPGYGYPGYGGYYPGYGGYYPGYGGYYPQYPPYYWYRPRPPYHRPPSNRPPRPDGPGMRTGGRLPPTLINMPPPSGQSPALPRNGSQPMRVPYSGSRPPSMAGALPPQQRRDHYDSGITTGRDGMPAMSRPSRPELRDPMSESSVSGSVAQPSQGRGELRYNPRLYTRPIDMSNEAGGMGASGEGIRAPTMSRPATRTVRMPESSAPERSERWSSPEVSSRTVASEPERSPSVSRPNRDRVRDSDD